MAPHFDPKNSSTLCMYLLDYEPLAKAAQLTLAERLAQSTQYLTKEDKDDWENLPEFRGYISRLGCLQTSSLQGVSQCQENPSYHQADLENL